MIPIQLKIAITALAAFFVLLTFARASWGWNKPTLTLALEIGFAIAGTIAMCGAVACIWMLG